MFKFLYTYRRLIIIALVFFVIWALIFKPFDGFEENYTSTGCDCSKLWTEYIPKGDVYCENMCS